MKTISRKNYLAYQLDLLVSSDYNSLYPSAKAQLAGKINLARNRESKTISPEDSKVFCELFNTGQLASLNKTGLFKVKYYNPEDLVLQHKAVKEDVYNETKQNVNLLPDLEMEA